MNAPILDNPYRLIESVYNSIKFDCLEVATNETCYSPCLEETHNVREDLLPYVEMMIRTLHDIIYNSLLEDLEAARGARDELISNVREEYFLDKVCEEDSLPHYAMSVLHPCLINLPEDSSDEFNDRLSMIISVMARMFRVQRCLASDALGSLENACIEEFGSYGTCSTPVWRLPDHALIHSLALFEAVFGGNDVLFRSGVALKSARINENAISSKAKWLLSALVRQNEPDFPHLCLLEKVHEVEGSSSDCHKELDMNSVLVNMDLVYKLYKQLIPPTSLVAREKSELLDAETMMTSLENLYNYKVHNETVLNDHATIMACRFGKEEMSQECNKFSNMFSSTGIAYSFNNAPFWTLLRNSTSNFDFHQEIYKKDYDDFDSALPRPISNIGKEFSLDFYIRHEPYGYTYKDDINYFESYQDLFLAVHDPFEVPNLRSEGINIQPGKFYEIRVFPTATITDKAGLAMDPQSRNCLKREENDELNIFNTYSQSSCMFECKLERAMKECNCCAWDYPRLETSINLCLGYDMNDCFQSVMNSELSEEECDCPNDCKHIAYDVDLRVTPLRPDNLIM